MMFMSTGTPWRVTITLESWRLTFQFWGRRHVVLPQEIAQLLPKGRLLSEVS